MMRRLAALLSVLALLLVAVPAPAFAYDPFHDVSGNSAACSSAEASASSNGSAGKPTICATNQQTNDPIGGPHGIMMKIINVIAVIAGIAAVIIIIIAGLRMVTSGGGDAAAGARRALIATAIGLVVVVIARQLVAFVIGKIS